MLYSVQFLRGIAALLVVIAHSSHKANQYQINIFQDFHIGGSGVDLFFIISGFIMCYTTYGKKVDFKSFIKNRIKRILPLYWLLTLIALILYLLYPHLINSSGGKTGIIESFFLIPNGSKFLINNGWTLSYEFYYYLIFSSLLFFSFNDKKRFSIIISYFVFATILGLAINFSNPYFLFLTSNLLLEFALGVICFLIFNKIKIKSIISILLLLSGIIILVYQNYHNLPKFIDIRGIKYGIPMFLIFLSMIYLEPFFIRSKSTLLSFFNHIGNSSYSLYLIHPFALTPTAMILKLMNINNPFIFIITLIFTSILAGSLTYILIEKRLNKIVKKYT